MRILVLVAALALAGCSLGGDGGGGVEAAELNRLVLQPEDLPRVFVRFDEGRQGIAEVGTDSARFGRVDGWKARYRRSGTPTTAGPLVVASLVDLFESSDGAGDRLAELREERTDPEAAWEESAAEELGDESVVLTTLQGNVRSYFVAWREGEVTASVDVNGFDGKLELSEALALARKQERRISEAR